MAEPTADLEAGHMYQRNRARSIRCRLPNLNHSDAFIWHILQHSATIFTSLGASDDFRLKLPSYRNASTPNLNGSRLLKYYWGASTSLGSEAAEHFTTDTEDMDRRIRSRTRSRRSKDPQDRRRPKSGNFGFRNRRPTKVDISEPRLG